MLVSAFFSFDRRFDSPNQIGLLPAPLLIKLKFPIRHAILHRCATLRTFRRSNAATAALVNRVFAK